ncbi:GRDP2 Glycine-rich domain-containing protein 2 [Candida maltosa Xu316]
MTLSKEKQEAAEKEEQLPPPPPYNDVFSTPSDPNHFRSYVYSTLEKDEPISKYVQEPTYIPSEAELITHLKLLRVFGNLRQKVNESHNLNPVGIWQAYLSDAVRRFIIFVSSIKHWETNNSLFEKKRNDIEDPVDYRSQEFTLMMNKMIPPLDVLMVWHSFILNPGSFYDVFARHDMFYFINYPFPLHLIDKFVNDQFEYVVPEEYRSNYIYLLSGFVSDDKSELEYDLDYDIDVLLATDKFTVYCPDTNEPMTKPCRNFTYYKFQVENLLNENESVTHDLLRKKQFLKDLKSGMLLEGSLKYLSPKLCAPEYSSRNPHVFNDEISARVAETWNDSLNLDKNLKALIDKPTFENKKKRTLTRLIVRNYNIFNYISHTVRHGITIGEDLVSCVMRQSKFIDSMNEFNWLQSPYLSDCIDEARIRYDRFFSMLTNPSIKEMLVPTLDIDLVWHTHQLMMYGYFRDCKQSPAHKFIDHNDKVDDEALDNGFDYTANEYKKIFGEEYKLCYCDFCHWKSKKRKDKVARFWKKTFNKPTEEDVQFEKNVTMGKH